MSNILQDEEICINSILDKGLDQISTTNKHSTSTNNLTQNTANIKLQNDLLDFNNIDEDSNTNAITKNNQLDTSQISQKNFPLTSSLCSNISNFNITPTNKNNTNIPLLNSNSNFQEQINLNNNNNILSKEKKSNALKNILSSLEKSSNNDLNYREVSNNNKTNMEIKNKGKNIFLANSKIDELSEESNISYTNKKKTKTKKSKKKILTKNNLNINDGETSDIKMMHSRLENLQNKILHLDKRLIINGKNEEYDDINKRNDNKYRRRNFSYNKKLTYNNSYKKIEYNKTDIWKGKYLKLNGEYNDNNKTLVKLRQEKNELNKKYNKLVGKVEQYDNLYKENENVINNNELLFNKLSESEQIRQEQEKLIISLQKEVMRLRGNFASNNSLMECNNGYSNDNSYVNEITDISEIQGNMKKNKKGKKKKKKN